MTASKGPRRRAVVVTDLGFGDQGKGTMTDWFVRDYGAHTVVRSNGGSQAAHNVIDPDGRHHTFAQFGAASFVPGVRTFLTDKFLLNPAAMLVEARALAEKGVPDILARTDISQEALVITPFHIATNRLRELARGQGRHGSCGNGISTCATDALILGEAVVRAGDLRDERTLRRKLRFLQRHHRAFSAHLIEKCAGMPLAGDEIAVLTRDDIVERIVELLRPFTRSARIVPGLFLGDVLRRDGTVVFEGAQGVLLDEWRGFHPYTTWSTCTGLNAHDLLDEFGFMGERENVGVLRAYATRHGAGPFVTEDAELTRRIPDVHNQTDLWQEGFRVGWFDAVTARYAVDCCGRTPMPEREGITSLAITCLDRLGEIGDDWKICNEYDASALARDEFAELFRADPRSPRDRVRAQNIVLGEHRDLSHQEEITNALSKVKPIYVSFPSSFIAPERRAEEYARFLGDLVGMPVRYLSSGMTANDKRRIG